MAFWTVRWMWRLTGASRGWAVAIVPGPTSCSNFTGWSRETCCVAWPSGETGVAWPDKGQKQMQGRTGSIDALALLKMAPPDAILVVHRLPRSI